jgi:hypothetical protein
MQVRCCAYYMMCENKLWIPFTYETLNFTCGTLIFLTFKCETLNFKDACETHTHFLSTIESGDFQAGNGRFQQLYNTFGL